MINRYEVSVEWKGQGFSEYVTLIGLIWLVIKYNGRATITIERKTTDFRPRI